MKLTKNKLMKITNKDCLGSGLGKVVHQLSTASVLKTGRVFASQLKQAESIQLKEIMTLDGTILCQSSLRKFENSQMTNEYESFVERTDLRDYLCNIKSSLYLITTKDYETVGYVMEMAETNINPLDLSEKAEQRWRKMKTQLRDVHVENVGFKRGTNKLVCIDYGMGQC